MKQKHVAILGCRGIPAEHGGFESFAESLALHLASNGWRVTVYCEDDKGDKITTTTWQDIRLIHIPSRVSGPLGTIIFDWRSILHASHNDQVMLTLGYNTAIFCIIHRIRRRRNVINMDGIEWMRKGTWTLPVRAWFYINEWFGCWLGNCLVADHPEIARHLERRVRKSKIVAIPYGADRITLADPKLLDPYGLRPGEYVLYTGRPQQDNSTLEVVRAFSQQVRGVCLVMLCSYQPDKNAYHRSVMDAASPEVKFLGGVYNRKVVQSLQFHSLLYIHGHQVGGTNPSLLEALGAGCAILSHNNKFTRWVAGDATHYFDGKIECANELNNILSNSQELEQMRLGSHQRYAEHLTWEEVFSAYEVVLSKN